MTWVAIVVDSVFISVRVLSTLSIKFALPFAFKMEFFYGANTGEKTGFKANQLYILSLFWISGDVK